MITSFTDIFDEIIWASCMKILSHFLKLLLRHSHEKYTFFNSCRKKFQEFVYLCVSTYLLASCFFSFEIYEGNNKCIVIINSLGFWYRLKLVSISGHLMNGVSISQKSKRMVHSISLWKLLLHLTDLSVIFFCKQLIKRKCASKKIQVFRSTIMRQIVKDIFMHARAFKNFYIKMIGWLSSNF